MANKVKGGYECGYCRKFYTDPIDADKCKEGHDLIYVAISREDLSRLINFIYTGESGLVTETLLNTLSRYLRGSFSTNIKKDKVA